MGAFDLRMCGVQGWLEAGTVSTGPAACSWMGGCTGDPAAVPVDPSAPIQSCLEIRFEDDVVAEEQRVAGRPRAGEARCVPCRRARAGACGGPSERQRQERTHHHMYASRAAQHERAPSLASKARAARRGRLPSLLGLRRICTHVYHTEGRHGRLPAWFARITGAKTGVGIRDDRTCRAHSQQDGCQPQQ